MLYLIGLIISTTYIGYGQAKQTNNNTVTYNIDDTETEDNFCDTTKITDFKRNLIILDTELTDIQKTYQLKKANDFINQSCKNDSLFCGEVNFKKSTSYKFNNHWKFLLTGYTLGQPAGMDEKSVSFFVLTILHNNKFYFTDILDDLMGEIQTNLSGFEYKKNQVNIWGYVYPYFNPDYGKFRLTVKNGVASYEYQCQARH